MSANSSNIRVSSNDTSSGTDTDSDDINIEYCIGNDESDTTAMRQWLDDDMDALSNYNTPCNQELLDALSNYITAVIADNSECPMEFISADYLYNYADIGTRERNLCPVVAAKLSLIDSNLYALTYRYRQSQSATYHKFKRKFGERLYARLIKHPFKYSSSISTITKMENIFLANTYGASLFDINLPFKQEFLNHNRVAIQNITLWTICKCDFVVMLYINTYPIWVSKVTSEMHAPLGIKITSYLDANNMQLVPVEGPLLEETQKILIDGTEYLL